ncbi:MAG: AAA family ATPase [Clostridia bacterium]|nr:AAA family ATPase [Clostridia bacterium]
MRIDKVEIDGFGKLNNCEFAFADGVNLIYGENESGKSTLCEFILAAFYGLPNESKKVADDITPRKKYRPWQSDSFGGRVYFTDDEGRRLVIERSFKGTKRGDKAVLRDAESWEEIDTADDIGQKYFGLSREGFLKTLYIKSFGADSLKSDDGEIMTRLSNMETSGAEDVSYSKILNSMEKEIFSLKTKTGRGGKISALEDRLRELNSEMCISRMTQNTLENDRHNLEILKNTTFEKEEEAKVLEEKYAQALQHEKFIAQKKIEESKTIIENRLKKEEEKLQNIKLQLEKINSDNEPVISAEEISRARALETKRLLAEERMVEAKREVPEKLRPILDETRLIPGFFGLVIFLIGFLLKSMVIYISGVLVAVVGILISLLINIKKRRDDDKKREVYYELRHEVDKINDELNSIFEPYGVLISDELSALYVSTNDKVKQASQLEQQLKDCEKEIESLKDTLPEKTEMVEFSEKVMEYSGEDAEKLFAKINALKSEIKQAQEEAHEISVRLVRETAEIRNEADIKAELDDIMFEKCEAEKRYTALCRAAEWLKSAHEEIKNNFAPRLNEKNAEYLSFLTSEKYKDVRANDSFELNLKTTSGEIVEAGFMSRGTYDLLYIALRFAAMNVMTEGHIPPVILDDAFSQLDNDRLLSAVELINTSPEFSQVILFTCHENYKDLLKNINVVSL